MRSVPKDAERADSGDPAPLVVLSVESAREQSRNRTLEKPCKSRRKSRTLVRLAPEPCLPVGLSEVGGSTRVAPHEPRCTNNSLRVHEILSVAQHGDIATFLWRDLRQNPIVGPQSTGIPTRWLTSRDYSSAALPVRPSPRNVSHSREYVSRMCFIPSCTVGEFRACVLIEVWASSACTSAGRAARDLSSP